MIIRTFGRFAETRLTNAVTWGTFLVMPNQSRRSRPLRLAARLALVTAVLFGMTTLGSSAYEGTGRPEDPNRPGLPTPNGAVITPRGTGINEASAALQWLRLPPVQTIAYVPPASPGRNDPTCRFSEFASSTRYTAEIYTVSPTDTTLPYGVIGPFTVRTAAFGSIPVEAEVVVEQAVDEDGLPIPIRFSQLTAQYCDHTSPFPRPPGNNARANSWQPAEATGPVKVTIRAVRVDGVDVDIVGNCQANEFSDLNLTSRMYHPWDPDRGRVSSDPNDIEGIMVADHYTAPNGGKLYGTVNIPDFAGCVTSAGDDISPILTATVSADENYVEMRTTGITPVAGEDNCAWRNECEPLPGIPFPEGDTEW